MSRAFIHLELSVDSSGNASGTFAGRGLREGHLKEIADAVDAAVGRINTRADEAAARSNVRLAAMLERAEAEEEAEAAGERCNRALREALGMGNPLAGCGRLR